MGNRPKEAPGGRGDDGAIWRRRVAGQPLEIPNRRQREWYRGVGGMTVGAKCPWRLKNRAGPSY
uniref:Uncharacterized protein n=1 Tax=Arundo donax TaxID=35708 RepID=A0A0A8YI85_ARUDO